LFVSRYGAGFGAVPTADDDDVSGDGLLFASVSPTEFSVIQK